MASKIILIDLVDLGQNIHNRYSINNLFDLYREGVDSEPSHSEMSIILIK